MSTAPATSPPVPDFLSHATFYRLTVEQYHQMIANGILGEEDPVELLEGYVVTKMPRSPEHDRDDRGRRGDGLTSTTQLLAVRFSRRILVNRSFFPLAGLSSVAFLLILQGCVPAWQPHDQQPTAPAQRERLEGVLPDHPKGAKRPANEDDLIRAILAAKDPSAAEDGYSSLFELVGNDGLLRLQSHASDTIAIQAAWMQVELTVPVKEPAQAVRPDREKLAWFLRFLEARARVTLPKWWAEAILDARANRRGNVYAGGINMSSDCKAGDPIFEKWPPKATIERKEGKLVVRLGKESASAGRLPREGPEAAGARL